MEPFEDRIFPKIAFISGSTVAVEFRDSTKTVWFQTLTYVRVTFLGGDKLGPR